MSPQIQRLVDRRPAVSAEELLDGFRPSERFGEVSFQTYRPDPAQPTQAQAVAELQRFAGGITGPKGGSGKGGGFLARMFGGGGAATSSKQGIYLDGGFGVGKTHLLASLWHEAPGLKSFGTFVEYTNLVGALTFPKTVQALSQYSLVCIDEFELDDPGDTVLMSRLMRELSDAGVKLAATSNTLPGSLGEGRFAAADFQREIQVLADQFEVLRIDGEDFRHRGLPEAPASLTDDQVESVMQQRFADSQAIAVDEFSDIVEHLSAVHPSRYRHLIKDLDGIVWRNVHTVDQQALALRLVVLADRLYDRDLPIVASGASFDQIFTPEMMAGGYQKKYYRAVSRLTALAREGLAEG
ncbi:cell division protein ZapE [Kocuria sp.]|uniref:cell division protein ZapE n=1 Tax=Kocuria sp. TaxID=1871328 RepID=UPI0026DEBB96|nr:cell division protein ZapE [Kocuria sp.]MDO5619345.1 cell division protein ZapE [Kocuria sp.]